MIMDPWVQALIVSITSIGASSGFWAFVLKRDKEKAATTKLLMGLGYGKIVQLGLTYIEQGWITKDELEELRKYLYEPYCELGGNGVAERIMSQVSNLPIKSPQRYSQIPQSKRTNRRGA
jgi:hypothetical protein